ncbi:MAG: hypothetical protein WCO84_02110 [bacterium]
MERIFRFVQFLLIVAVTGVVIILGFLVEVLRMAMILVPTVALMLSWVVVANNCYLHPAEFADFCDRVGLAIGFPPIFLLCFFCSRHRFYRLR